MGGPGTDIRRQTCDFLQQAAAVVHGHHHYINFGVLPLRYDCILSAKSLHSWLWLLYYLVVGLFVSYLLARSKSCSALSQGAQPQLASCIVVEQFWRLFIPGIGSSLAMAPGQWRHRVPAQSHVYA